MVSSTKVLVHYKGNLNVSSTLLIQQAIAEIVEKEIDLIQDGGKIKRQNDIDHHCSAQTVTRIGLLEEIPRSGVQIPCLHLKGHYRCTRSLCYQAQTPV
jgi:hypothetical protein